jgi:hypothetical protein
MKVIKSGRINTYDSGTYNWFRERHSLGLCRYSDVSWILWPSGIYRHIVRMWSDVSKERMTRIFRVESQRNHLLHVGFLADFRPWRWRLYVTAKRLLTYRVHDAVSQKIATFITIAARTRLLQMFLYCTRICSDAETMVYFHVWL